MELGIYNMKTNKNEENKRLSTPDSRQNYTKKFEKKREKLSLSLFILRTDSLSWYQNKKSPKHYIDVLLSSILTQPNLKRGSSEEYFSKKTRNNKI